MIPVRSRIVVFSVAVLWCIVIALPAAADDFYQQQLRAGKNDRAAGKLVQASDELRIAAFGFLDRPPLLVEALAHLALAQSALGQDPRPTLDRFVEVERQFPSYAKAAIEAPVRNAFESLLLASEPQAALRAVPSLALLLRSPAQKVSDLPAAQRAAAYEEGARREPREIEWPLAAAADALSRGLDSEAVVWARRAQHIDKDSERAHVLLAHALTRGADCRAALREISALPAAVLQKDADLIGDQLVCLTNQRRWADADALASKVSEAVRKRTDVARALQTLATRRR